MTSYRRLETVLLHISNAWFQIRLMVLTATLLGLLPMQWLSHGETVTINAAADTTLHEFFPDNNFGAFTHVAAGATGSPKPDGSLFVTRGLYRFDLAGRLPAAAKVTSAKVVLKVTFAPGGARNSTFEIRRALQAWGEGTKSNQAGNTGQPATANEASWTRRLAPATSWNRPGGGAQIDFSAAISATAAVAGQATYTFESNSNMIADVQAWIENPAANFGWILMTQSETSPQTARRFGSREDAANAPALIIEYTPQSAGPLQITSIIRQENSLALAWSGAAPPYQLQTKPAVAQAAWSNIGGPVTATSTTVPMIGSQALYRIAAGPAATSIDVAAQYEVTFNAEWSPATHPQDYPAGAHWSGLVGGTHNAETNFWSEGQMASDGIKDVAELGSKTRLLAEVDAALRAGTVFNTLSGGGIGSGSGSVKLTFSANREFPLVTLVSMIAPSPDWFVGVSGLSLIENGAWVQNKVVTLFLYDAGTDSGPSYASANQVTSPHQPIKQFTTFPALVNGSIVPFGTFNFRKL
jgi:hypothetical protein